MVRRWYWSLLSNITFQYEFGNPLNSLWRNMFKVVHYSFYVHVCSKSYAKSQSHSQELLRDFSHLDPEILLQESLLSVEN